MHIYILCIFYICLLCFNYVLCVFLICYVCFIIAYQVKHKMAIYLLFQEAYSNYLESLYPCSDQDVIVLGGILLQITCGDFDNKKMKKYFSSLVL